MSNWIFEPEEGLTLTNFANEIGLSENWPKEVTEQDEMSISGLLSWVNAYFRAAEHLVSSSGIDHGSTYYRGPVLQIVGLTAELTLKAMLRGSGKTQEELKKFQHNTYKAYFAARECFDEVKFFDLHFSNTDHIQIPNEVLANLVAKQEKEPEIRWRVFFDHLRLLDENYDRPYRSRYVLPGAIVLPDAEIVLVGVKLLLTAMEDRLKILDES